MDATVPKSKTLHSTPVSIKTLQFNFFSSFQYFTYLLEAEGASLSLFLHEVFVKTEDDGDRQKNTCSASDGAHLNSICCTNAQHLPYKSASDDSSVRTWRKSRFLHRTKKAWLRRAVTRDPLHWTRQGAGRLFLWLCSTAVEWVLTGICANWQDSSPPLRCQDQAPVTRACTKKMSRRCPQLWGPELACCQAAPHMMMMIHAATSVPGSVNTASSPSAMNASRTEPMFRYLVCPKLELL